MMATKVTKIDMQRIVSKWCEQHSIRLCVLFGSQATGKTHAHSDIDLAVWTTDPTLALQKLAWLAELELSLQNEVSLVFVSPDLDPVLGFEVVRNGRLLFEVEPELWLKERSRLWHAYNDSLPFLRAARAKLKQSVAEEQNGT